MRAVSSAQRGRIEKQLDWMRERGGTASGYLAHYAGLGYSVGEVLSIFHADVERLQAVLGGRA